MKDLEKKGDMLFDVLGKISSKLVVVIGVIVVLVSGLLIGQITLDSIIYLTDSVIFGMLGLIVVIAVVMYAAKQFQMLDNPDKDNKNGKRR